jgi:3-hydroxyacyl-CoA dehydrogenase
MGAQIAAHLANAGVPTLLLDISPRELTPEEQAKGLKLESPQVRNRIARSGLEARVKASRRRSSFLNSLHSSRPETSTTTSQRSKTAI